jgi:hypothetical protein
MAKKKQTLCVTDVMDVRRQISCDARKVVKPPTYAPHDPEWMKAGKKTKQAKMRVKGRRVREPVAWFKSALKKAKRRYL